MTSDSDKDTLRSTVQLLATSNVRLCDIALAADDLSTFLEKLLESPSLTAREKAAGEAALLAYKIARGGN